MALPPPRGVNRTVSIRPSPSMSCSNTCVSTTRWGFVVRERISAGYICKVQKLLANAPAVLILCRIGYIIVACCSRRIKALTERHSVAMKFHSHRLTGRWELSEDSPMKYRLKRCIYVLSSVFTTRVRSGPLKGSRWTLFSGIRFVRGTFEPEKTAIIINALGMGDVFWDVGANVGYFTVLGAKIVGKEGAVVAIEPSPVNLAFLKRNVKLNKAENVTILPIAAGAAQGTVRLNTRSGRGTHCVDNLGDTLVDVNSIDSLIQSGLPSPTFVKIDVEGFEEYVIEGMKTCLRMNSPKLLVAVHTESAEKKYTITVKRVQLHSATAFSYAKRRY